MRGTPRGAAAKRRRRSPVSALCFRLSTHRSAAHGGAPRDSATDAGTRVPKRAVGIRAQSQYAGQVMSRDAAEDRPTLVDRTFQLAYKGAYQLMRTYWRVRRPTTHGALVELWHEGELLLVRNSYVGYYTLPGGYIHSGETSRDAAVRELSEEIGLRALPS